jgi:cytochrome c oxidase subunit 3
VVNGAAGALPVLLGLRTWLRLQVVRDAVAESESGLYSKRSTSRSAGAWLVHLLRGDVLRAFFALCSMCARSAADLGSLDAAVLWPDFKRRGPSSGAASPRIAGPDRRAFCHDGPWPIPPSNTLILLTSGVTLTIAHHALIAGSARAPITFMWITVLLGIIFLGFQVYEYIHAYQDLNLKLSSGLRSTFFMLTGFHGFHVFIGMLMLLFITLRLMRGHFTPERHFGFEGAAWYWHFVDVVWLGLYIVVYWL